MRRTRVARRLYGYHREWADHSRTEAPSGGRGIPPPSEDVPEEERLEKVREVRDEIEQKILGWLERSEKELEKLRNERERRERIETEAARAARYRWAYEVLGLRVVVDGNADLRVTWSFGDESRLRLLAREEPTRQGQSARRTVVASRRATSRGAGSSSSSRRTGTTI
jgi:hypothetical protein